MKIFRFIKRRILSHPKTTAKALALLGVPGAAALIGLLPADGLDMHEWQKAGIHAAAAMMAGGGLHGLLSTDHDKTDHS